MSELRVLAAFAASSPLEVGFLIDTFPKPVVLADALVPDCPIVGASDSFARLCGYSRDEILGKNCRLVAQWYPFSPFVGSRFPYKAIPTPKKGAALTRTWLLGCQGRFLLKDVPGCCISRSGRKNLRSMIRMCRLIGLSAMGSTSCTQAGSAHSALFF